MPFMLVRHRVADYSTWKPEFDEHGITRKSYGSMSEQLFRNADDQNECIMLFEWDNLEHARRFMESDDLRAAMQRGGVIDQDVQYLQETREEQAAR
jgi:heme-degrading monooxygenase HmoA